MKKFQFSLLSAVVLALTLSGSVLADKGVFTSNGVMYDLRAIPEKSTGKVSRDSMKKSEYSTMASPTNTS